MNAKDNAIDLPGLKPWDLIDIDLPTEEFSADVIPEADKYDISMYDIYAGAQVDMPQGGEQAQGKVLCRVTDDMGNLKGQYHPNLLVNTSGYRVEFPDDGSEEYSANLIADKCFALVNDEGCEHLLLDEVMMHRTTDAALTMENCWFLSANGQKQIHPTNKGWQLLVCWKDGTSS